MSYNTNLEERIDATAKRWKNVHKKKMFGGVCWLLRGNMAFGIWKDFLIVRIKKELAENILRDLNVQPFDITGRPMTGWIMVKETGWTTPLGLAKWISMGKAFALSLPEKKKAKAKRKTLREYRKDRS